MKFKSIVIVCVFVLSSILTTINVNADSEIIEPEITNSDKVIEDKDKVDNQEIQEDFEVIEEESKITNKEEVTEQNFTEIEEPSNKSNQNEEELPKEPDSSEDDDKVETETNEKKMDGEIKNTEKSQAKLLMSVVEESSTSRLGHLRKTAKIYPDLENHSEFYQATDGYTNAVYYVKKQAQLEGEKYYLISTKPSSKEGVVGWVKESELDSHSHQTVDAKNKTFYVKGTGSAYSKAWGGSRDLVYSNLSSHSGATFQVNLTEKVGSSIWYRGKLDGKTAWIHESYLTTIKELSTSRLGHLRKTAKIYPDLENQSEFHQATDGYTNAVYYVKKQAQFEGEKYYLISTKPSSKEGVVGWVKESELDSHSHQTVDAKNKTFYVKGNGSAYSKAWGGSRDLVYSNLSSHSGATFQVNLTEKVGSNIWYRGELDGKTAWVHESYLTTITESSTSRLGHLRKTAKIYPDLENQSEFHQATDGYTNTVYYVKKQAQLEGEKYYLISTKPSSKEGVVGWVKESELDSHSHQTVDAKNKTFYVKGNGSAYSKAWGGSRDLVYSNLSSHSGATFQVNLTEKVGSNIWHRGKLDGKTAWIHESYLTTIKELSTSRLGHLRKTAKIYSDLENQSEFYQATDGYTNRVYYVKKQAQFEGEKYYLISTKPSSKEGVVGWVKESELDSHSHQTVDAKNKTFYVKGTGSAYSKAWGGSRDLVYSNLSSHSGATFQVNLTEKVGNNIWYRGKLNGKTAWVHESYVVTYIYDLTLNQALNIQMTAGPQTTNNYDTYVSKKYINSKKEVTADVLNVRGGPGSNYWVVGQLSYGKKVTVLKETNGWYQIEFTKNHQFVNASSDDVKYYLDPRNFVNDPKQRFQFLDLSKPSGVTKTELNKFLQGKGILSGQGQAFIDAGKNEGINDIYLVSHALLETGNGSSTLAKGVIYNGKTVYNMYGYGAYDSCPITCGAMTAYNEGWTTPYKAIVGGAKYIGNSYIKSGLNTLYKMRWNPGAMATTNRYGKQYATDIGWAAKQVNTMYKLYEDIGSYSLELDIPVYK